MHHFRMRTQEWCIALRFAALHAPYGAAMPEYRRLYVSGGTYFFTVALANRASTLLVDEIDAHREAWRFAAERHPFRTVAYVVLPDHLHCIWTLPAGDRNFSVRWKVLKARFSRAIDPACDPARGRRAGERGIWQRRFWEHLIRDETDYGAHLAYIHNNPVKHGYVTDRRDWPHSSWRYHRDMATWPEDREDIAEP
jgi:putative transposase